jgi:hypothetical protein
VRAFLGGLIALALVGPATAHEIIEPGLVPAVDDRLATLRALHDEAEGAERARAACELAALLVEVVELANRSIAMHGGRPSGRTEELIATLERHALHPGWSPAGPGLRIERESLRRCLLWTDDPAQAAEARLHLLRAAFYESFRDDPRRPIGVGPEDIERQIESARSFLDAHPSHPNAEEAAFILAVEGHRAFLQAPAGRRDELARRARQLIAGYLDDHAGGGLRAEALRGFLAELDTAGVVER